MLGLWLGLCKDLFLYRDQQRDHAWRKQPRHVCGVDGARVLCVGMGDIGSAFARKAHALGARVVGVRRTAHPDQPCPPYCLRVVGQDALDAELPEADLVALSLPGTGETAHLMNADRLARMKEGAILINVGRGTAVDTDALAAALHSGHLRGAGLDVTDPEPLPPDHPLWDEPGAVITPHNAGHFSWLRTLDNIVAICGVNLRHLMAGEPLDNQVARGARYVTGAAPGRRLQGTDLSL
nr:D-2-hydroxyacid dehydrogenase [uncultured Subdoligranulum sp.]